MAEEELGLPATAATGPASTVTNETSWAQGLRRSTNALRQKPHKQLYTLTMIFLLGPRRLEAPETAMYQIERFSNSTCLTLSSERPSLVRQG